jgi:hypothetical protein
MRQRLLNSRSVSIALGLSGPRLPMTLHTRSTYQPTYAQGNVELTLATWAAFSAATLSSDAFLFIILASFGVEASSCARAAVVSYVALCGLAVRSTGREPDKTDGIFPVDIAGWLWRWCLRFEVEIFVVLPVQPSEDYILLHFLESKRRSQRHRGRPDS